MIRWRTLWAALRWPVLMLLGVVTVFFKLVLTRQFTFLEAGDGAYQVLPWLQLQVSAIRQGSVVLWDPYEWFGQSLIGQLQPAIASPFTFLLALAPLHDGHLNVFYVHIWFVLIHCVAALFAYGLFLDLGCGRAAAAIGGLFYATAAYCGNTEWPQLLAAAIWAPLVFLFLLRSLRGRRPRKSAAWAGVALGFSWLSGHHGPSLLLTLAVAGTCVVYLVRRASLRHALPRAAILFSVLALVSAVQVLPTAEYGKHSVRWTESGVLKWNDRVGFEEHQNAGLKATDLIHLILPGSTTMFDTFEGVIGLSLAALAIWGAFGKREVRLFAVLAIAALLYAMARNDVLYGLLYALVPMVEKAREPIVAVSIVHFGITGLVAFGADALLHRSNLPQASGMQKLLLGFAAITCLLFYLVFFIRPTVTSAVVDGDARPLMSAVIALMMAGLLQLWKQRHLRAEWLGVLLCLLVIIEQGNEAGWSWIEKHDTRHATYLKQLEDTRDIAAFLRTRPDPKRVEANPKDLGINFGDWFGIDATRQYTPSAPEQIMRLNWWQDRPSNMLGVGYTLSKSSTRAGQRDVFTSKSGLKVFANPEAFPRAWTVHSIRGASDEDSGAAFVREGTFDLRRQAVMVGAQPALATCEGADAVTSVQERLQSAQARVYMACRGLLIFSDNDYPGWRASVDGHSAPVWQANTALRAVVVEAGSHEVVLQYRPFPVYFGFVCTLLGLAAAVFLQQRPEADAVDVMA